MPPKTHPPTFSELISRLSQHKPRKIPGAKWMRSATVAAIFRETQSNSPYNAELLFIQRAIQPNDKWSGHMAFPGGHVDKNDADSLAASIRETQEEIGLDLSSHTQHIGELSQIFVRPLPPTIIAPHMFALTPQHTLTPFTPNAEVKKRLWIPLHFFLDPKNRSSIPYNIAGLTVPLPCYQYKKHIIWGLTLRMLDELISCLQTQPPHAR